jgi:RNA polymerase sigma factor (sigma-70 family)
MLPHEQAYTQNFTAEKASTNDARRVKMKQVVKAIIQTQLTDRQKQIMLMHYAEGKSISEIGRELGINRSNVYRRMEAAKKRIEKIKKIFKYVAW